MTSPQDFDTTAAEVSVLADTAASAARAVANTSARDRAAWLHAVADALDAAAEGLTDVALGETALTRPRLTGEVARTTAQLRLFARVIVEGSYLEAAIDHPDSHATPAIPDLRRMLRPIGPVAVFAASNFPFAFSVAGGDMASALAVGCPVIVKAHPGHPVTAALTAECVSEALRGAGAPEGAFALVHGVTAGIALAQHSQVRAVAFTGSLRGGRAVQELIAARETPIPFYGELGSLNPVVITEAAAASRSASLVTGLAASFQLGSGQFCTKPGLVFIPANSDIPQLLRTHLATAGRLLTPTIAAGYEAGLDRVRATPDLKLVTGEASENSPTTGFAVTDLAHFASHTDVLTEEVFGPYTLLVEYPEDTALQAALEMLPGSLTSTIHAEPGEDLGALVEVLEDLSGRILFDGWPTGVAVSWAQNHGGPWPSATAPFTSVGATSVRRFLRPVAYQDAPERVLPPELHDSNPLGIPRRIDGALIVPE